MWQWLTQHGTGLQVLLNGLMVLIWIAYLQVFLIGFRRQHRSDILITVGAGVGLKARCFITNLGLEPIYLLDIAVDIGTVDGDHRAIITDRTELSDDELNNPAEATNQGPLKSGSFIDIGSFETLVRRAGSKDQAFNPDEDVRWIEITVLAVTSATSDLAGASRKYIVRPDDSGDLHLWPTSVVAKQVRSRAGRRRLEKELSSRVVSE